MKVIKTKLVRFIRAEALTIFPFIFVDPDSVNSPFYRQLLDHEEVHGEQQKRWAIYGLGVGLLAWWLLYLLALPVAWNPFRYKWEKEAYQTTSVMTDEEFNSLMHEAPYYLWLM